MAIGVVLVVLVVLTDPSYHFAPHESLEHRTLKYHLNELDYRKFHNSDKRCGPDGGLCDDGLGKLTIAIAEAEPRGLVIDIGIGRGSTSLHALSLSRDVWSFDPFQNHVKLLGAEEVVGNKYHSHSRIFQVLPLDHSGEILPIRYNGGVPELVRGVRHFTADVTDVKTVKLDDLTIKRDVALLKIHLGGLEGKVLLGSSELLKLQRVRYIVFDFNPAHLMTHSGIAGGDLLQKLQGLGYAIYVTCPNGRIDSATRKMLPVQCGRPEVLAKQLREGKVPVDNLIREDLVPEVVKTLTVNTKHTCCTLQLIAHSNSPSWDADVWWH
eukprot:CAMPEP_0175971082 /NCGR_PEP_ID=MMETSP0108-20121206/41453_1 /TAXON_ID=195067 ORGANISM="Goniomonas pacifica, Strain CCMP1869" /NCGR_SAMPLE_ID=MMETSP0108 /ASSEMBLY_ACC=CAM_ASM_000204 /LENGTH=323 /DNA_ID=CAMNT_0017300203 /DNA_START=10 /DNA_END=982 /DNA_ORIENTATION=+